MSLGPNLMSEISRRCWAAGSPPTMELLRDAGQQWAYSLDAPDEIPAGTVDWYEDKAFGVLSGPLDRMVQREA